MTEKEADKGMAGGILGVLEEGKRKKHSTIVSLFGVIPFVGSALKAAEGLYYSHREDGFKTCFWTWWLVFFTGLFYGLSWLTQKRFMLAPEWFHDISHAGAMASLASGGFLFLSLFKLVERKRNAWQFAHMFAYFALLANLLWWSGYSLILILINIRVISLLEKHRDVFILRAKYMLDPASILPLTLVALTIGYGVVGAKYFGGMVDSEGNALHFSRPVTTWTDALYFTLVTVTTVGYGDYSPLPGPEHTGAQWFVITLILLGVVSFLSSIVGVLGPFIENKLKSVLNLIEKISKELLNNHVIIAGSSEVTEPMVDILVENGVNFLVITEDNEFVSKMKEKGVRVVCGDPKDEELLEEMGIAKASALVACGDSDADNAFIALIGATYPKLKVIAMVHTKENVRKFELIGVHSIVSPTLIGSKDLFKMAVREEGGVLLLGKSDITEPLIERLVENGKQFTFLSQDKEFVSELVSRNLQEKGAQIYHGDTSHEANLRGVGIEEMRLVIAVESTDPENAFSVLTAKNINPNVKVAAVVHNKENISKFRKLKVDHIISPSLIGGKILAHAAIGHEVAGT